MDGEERKAERERVTTWEGRCPASCDLETLSELLLWLLEPLGGGSFSPPPPLTPVGF